MGKMISWYGGLRWMPDIGEKVIVGAATVHNSSGALGVVTGRRELQENNFFTEYRVRFADNKPELWFHRDQVYRPDLYETATY
jgi:hypothetical protein